MKDTPLKEQVISLCVTVALIVISTLVFKGVSLIDYLLMAVGTAELIGIVITLVRKEK